MVNEAITYNFMNSFKSDKDLIVEKNILNNAYAKIFENKCFKSINGVVKFKKYFGHGVNIKKNELLKFNFKSITI